MENKEFGILTEVLTLIGSGSKKSSLENTISSIIADYTPYLSEEQKNAVMREFMHYAKAEQKKSSPLFENMEKERFTMLIEILRFMERQDLNGKGVEDTLASLINRFDNNLTTEQKNVLVKEFSDYL